MSHHPLVAIALSAALLCMATTQAAEVLTLHEQALMESATREAREAYKKAQFLKQQNRFDEARQEFAILADLNGPGTEEYAALAADELDYGLLLHEANHWLLKFGSAMQDQDTRLGYQAHAENLYRQILELNAGNLERTQDIQLRLDQLLISRQAFNNAAQAQVMSYLSQFRHRLDEQFLSTGELPDQRKLAVTLADTLEKARQPRNRLLIKDYWRSAEGYYLILMDQQGGPNIKIKGDSNGSTMEQIN